MIALIDDTGDPGTGGAGRPWFGYVSLAIPNAHIADAFAFRDKAATLMAGSSGRPENWHAADRNLDDVFGTLHLMANEFGGWSWHAVLSNTTMSTRTTAEYIHDPSEHRYWVLLWLLERISWLAEGRNEKASVYVERCGAINEPDLRDRYKRGLPRGRGANQKYLEPDSIHIAEPSKMHLLNLADAIAYAVGKAVNPHPRRGETFPEYLRVVWPRVWVGPVWGNRSLGTNGFVLLPVGRRAEHLESLPFVTEWRESLGLKY